MFAVGHLALGYLFAKSFQKPLKTRINLPLIFLLSIISDIDLLFPEIKHRSITHSILTLTLASIPFIIHYRKTSIPYFAALTQHALIGDLITNGGVELLWPLTNHTYGLGIEQYGVTSITLEWLTFLLALTLLAKTNDWKTLFQNNQSNLLLTIPSAVILTSMLISIGTKIPATLLIPHMIFLSIFALSILKLVHHTQKTKRIAGTEFNQSHTNTHIHKS